MPVRKIPRNFRSVTGTMPSVKNGRSISYESLLERDFFLLLEFDADVLKYEEQPFSIEYPRNHRKYRYTPDCLVYYHSYKKLPCVFEIKFSDEVKSKKVFFDDKFNEIEKYITINKMEFKLFTELDIRTGFLENIKFLYRFAFLDDQIKTNQIMSLISSDEEVTVSNLLGRINSNRYVQAEYLPFIWHAVFKSLLKADLSLSLNNSTFIWVNIDV